MTPLEEALLERVRQLEEQLQNATRNRPYISRSRLDDRIADAYQRFPKKSNRKLATICGCSHPMIGQWKKRNNIQ